MSVHVIVGTQPSAVKPPEPIKEHATSAKQHEMNAIEANDLKNSTPHYMQAESIHVHTGDHEAAARMYTRAGKRAAEQGLYDASAVYHYKAIEHYQVTNNHAAVAKAYTDIAKMDTNVGDHASAKESHESAAAAHRAANNHAAAAVSDAARKKSMVKSWFQLKRF